MARQPKSPSYEEVVGDKAALNAEVGPSIKPDQPYTAGPDGTYTDPGHVNPAINPATPWYAAERPAPVPVINDPGLLGDAPNLADLNRAAAASYGTELADPTSGITEEGQTEAIRDAALRRLSNLQRAKSDVERDARQGAVSKLGSASK